MALLGVYRRVPPQLRPCKAKGCGKLVEWVTTVAGERWMPLRATPVVTSVHEAHDGRLITVIDSTQTHFEECKGPRTMGDLRHKQARQRPRRQSTQPRLF